MEAQAARDVKCIDQVRDVMPELTINNVKRLAELLRKETGCAVQDPFFNAILRRFHRIRYA